MKHIKRFTALFFEYLYRFIQFLLSPFVIYIALICIQAIYLLYFASILTDFNGVVRFLFISLSAFMIFYLISKDENTNYKMTWIFFIMLLPNVGGLLYLLLGNKRPSRWLKKKIQPEVQYFNQTRQQDPVIRNQIINKKIISLDYLNRQSFPIYNHTECKYYSLSDYNYQDMIKDLLHAKHFIFMEYFIVSKGLMFDTIIGILKQKVKEGVDVRFIFDDFGSFTTVPLHFAKKLEEAGIKTVMFNRFIPVFSLSQNHRDHRKICVIDGYIGYSGGFNLADEYINCKMRFGHWKDTGIRLEGEAVWSLTSMFLSTFYAYHKEYHGEDIEQFKPHTYHPEPFKNTGYVLPYGDDPLDDEGVGESVYLNMITHASRSIDIMTPYFIIDDVMLKALCLASKNGVKIRLYVPHVPDKKLVFRVTRSYYYGLIRAGIEVYEYLPGFLHAKVMLVDGKAATVGTINFDYRSLYLHFECNVLLYEAECLSAIKRDFREMNEICAPVKIDDSRHFKGLVEGLLRLFSPLL